MPNIKSRSLIVEDLVDDRQTGLKNKMPQSFESGA